MTCDAGMCTEYSGERVSLPLLHLHFFFLPFRFFCVSFQKFSKRNAKKTEREHVCEAKAGKILLLYIAYIPDCGKYEKEGVAANFITYFTKFELSESLE